jgi:hypothetical protein
VKDFHGPSIRENPDGTRVTKDGFSVLPTLADMGITDDEWEKARKASVEALYRQLQKHHSEDYLFGGNGPLERDIPAWAQRVNINGSIIAAAADWSFALDAIVYNFVGPQIVSLPCGRRSRCTVVLPANVQIQAIFTTDLRETTSLG